VNSEPIEFLSLLDQAEIELSSLHARMGSPSSIDLGALIELSRKLPSGFVHADALWLISEPPEDLEPLAPGSAWYAAGRELLVVVRSGDRWNAAELLKVVYTYYCAAQQVYLKLADRPEILDALLSGEDIDSENRTQWALCLDAPLDFFHRIEAENAELRFDLGWMGRRSFCPLVHIHSSLRPQIGQRRGREAAAQLLEKLPEGPIRLIVSDNEGIVDPISPYLRDLVRPICQWGRENESSLSVEGLYPQLVGGQLEDSIEMAALVLPDLLSASEELLSEKRVAEAQAGLHFVHDDALKIAWSSIDKLEGADPFVVQGNTLAMRAERLVLISARSEESLLAAARLVLDTGRVVSVAGVFALDGTHLPAVISTSCLIGSETAIRLQAQAALVEKAQEAQVEIEVLKCIGTDVGPRINPTALRLALLVNRQKHVQRIEGHGAEIVDFFTFYRRNTGVERLDLNFGLGRIQAHRITLATLLTTGLEPPETRKKPSKYSKPKHFRV